MYSSEYMNDNDSVFNEEHIKSSDERAGADKILVNDEQDINSINLSLEKSLENCSESTSNDSLCRLLSSSQYKILKTKRRSKRHKSLTNDETLTKFKNYDDLKMNTIEQFGDIGLINTINECLMNVEETNTSDSSDYDGLGKAGRLQFKRRMSDDFLNIFENGNVKTKSILQSAGDNFIEGNIEGTLSPILPSKTIVNEHSKQNSEDCFGSNRSANLQAMQKNKNEKKTEENSLSGRLLEDDINANEIDNNRQNISKSESDQRKQNIEKVELNRDTFKNKSNFNQQNKSGKEHRNEMQNEMNELRSQNPLKSKVDEYESSSDIDDNKIVTKISNKKTTKQYRGDCIANVSQNEVHLPAVQINENEKKKREEIIYSANLSENDIQVNDTDSNSKDVSNTVLVTLFKDENKSNDNRKEQGRSDGKFVCWPPENEMDDNGMKKHLKEISEHVINSSSQIIKSPICEDRRNLDSLLEHCINVNETEQINTTNETRDSVIEANDDQELKEYHDLNKCSSQSSEFRIKENRSKIKAKTSQISDSIARGNESEINEDEIRDKNVDTYLSVTERSITEPIEIQRKCERYGNEIETRNKNVISESKVDTPTMKTTNKSEMHILQNCICDPAVGNEQDEIKRTTNQMQTTDNQRSKTEGTVGKNSLAGSSKISRSGDEISITEDIDEQNDEMETTIIPSHVGGNHSLKNETYNMIDTAMNERNAVTQATENLQYQIANHDETNIAILETTSECDSDASTIVLDFDTPSYSFQTNLNGRNAEHEDTVRYRSKAHNVLCNDDAENVTNNECDSDASTIEADIDQTHWLSSKEKFNLASSSGDVRDTLESEPHKQHSFTENNGAEHTAINETDTLTTQIITSKPNYKAKSTSRSLDIELNMNERTQERFDTENVIDTSTTCANKDENINKNKIVQNEVNVNIQQENVDINTSIMFEKFDSLCANEENKGQKCKDDFNSASSSASATNLRRLNVKDTIESETHKRHSFTDNKQIEQNEVNANRQQENSDLNASITLEQNDTLHAGVVNERQNCKDEFNSANSSEFATILTGQNANDISILASETHKRHNFADNNDAKRTISSETYTATTQITRKPHYKDESACQSSDIELNKDKSSQESLNTLENDTDKSPTCASKDKDIDKNKIEQNEINDSTRQKNSDINTSNMSKPFDSLHASEENERQNSKDDLNDTNYSSAFATNLMGSNAKYTLENETFKLRSFADNSDPEHTTASETDTSTTQIVTSELNYEDESACQSSDIEINKYESNRERLNTLENETDTSATYASKDEDIDKNKIEENEINYNTREENCDLSASITLEQSDSLHAREVNECLNCQHEFNSANSSDFATNLTGRNVNDISTLASKTHKQHNFTDNNYAKDTISSETDTSTTQITRKPHYEGESACQSSDIELNKDENSRERLDTLENETNTSTTCASKDKDIDKNKIEQNEINDYTRQENSDLNTAITFEKFDSLYANGKNELKNCKINISLMIEALPQCRQTNTFEENVQALFQNLKSMQSRQCTQRKFEDVFIPRPIKIENDNFSEMENENNDVQGHNLQRDQEKIELSEIRMNEPVDKGYSKLCDIDGVFDSHKSQKKMSAHEGESQNSKLSYNSIIVGNNTSLDLRQGGKNEPIVKKNELDDVLSSHTSLNIEENQSKELLNISLVQESDDELDIFKRTKRTLPLVEESSNESLNDERRKMKSPLVKENAHNNLVLDDNLLDLHKTKQTKLANGEENLNQELSIFVFKESNDHTNINKIPEVEESTNREEQEDLFDSRIRPGKKSDVRTVRKKRKNKLTGLEENLIKLTINDNLLKNVNLSDSYVRRRNDEVIEENLKNLLNYSIDDEVNSNTHTKQKNILPEVVAEELLNDSQAQKDNEPPVDDVTLSHDRIEEINDISDSHKRQPKQTSVAEEKLNKVTLNDTSILGGNLLDSLTGREKKSMDAQENLIGDSLVEGGNLDKRIVGEIIFPVLENQSNDSLSDSVIKNTFKALDLLDSHTRREMKLDSNKQGTNEPILNEATNHLLNEGIIQEINDVFDSDKRKKSKSPVIKNNRGKFPLDGTSFLGCKSRRKKLVVAEENLSSGSWVVEDLSDELINDVDIQNTYDAFNSSEGSSETDDVASDGIIQEINAISNFHERKKKKLENPNDSSVQETKSNKPKKRKNKLLVVEEPNEFLNGVNRMTDNILCFHKNGRNEQMVDHVTNDLDTVIQEIDDLSASRKQNKKKLVCEENIDMTSSNASVRDNLLETHPQTKKKSVVADANNCLIMERKSNKRKKKKNELVVVDNLSNEFLKDVTYNVLDLHPNGRQEPTVKKPKDSLVHERKPVKLKKTKKALLVKDENNELLNVIEKPYDILDSHLKGTNETIVEGNELFSDGIIRDVKEISRSHKRKIKKSAIVEENLAQLPLYETSHLVSNLMVTHKGRQKSITEEDSNKDSLSLVRKSDKHKKRKKKLVEDPNKKLHNSEIMDTLNEATNVAAVDDVTNKMFNNGIIQEINNISDSHKRKEKKPTADEENLDKALLNNSVQFDGNLFDLFKGRQKDSEVAEDSLNEDSLSRGRKLVKHKKRKKKLLEVEDLNNELLNEDVFKNMGGEAIVDVVTNELLNDGTIQEIKCVSGSRKKKKKKSVIKENVLLNGTSVLSDNLLDLHEGREGESEVADEIPNKDLNHARKLDKHKKRKKKLLEVEDLNNELLNMDGVMDTHKEASHEVIEDIVTNELLNDVTIQEIIYVSDSHKKKKKKSVVVKEHVLLNDTSCRDGNLLDLHAGREKKSQLAEEIISEDFLSHEKKLEKHKRRKRKLLEVEDPKNELLNDDLITHKEAMNEVIVDDGTREINYISDSRKKKKKKSVNNTSDLDLDLENESEITEEKPNKDSLSHEMKLNKHKKRKKKIEVEDLNIELLNDDEIKNMDDVMDTHKAATNEAIVHDVMNELVNDGTIQEINCKSDSRKKKKKKSVVIEKDFYKVLVNNTSDFGGNLLDLHKGSEKESEVEEENPNEGSLSHRKSKHKKRNKKLPEVEDLNNKLLNDNVIKNMDDIMITHKEATNEAIVDDITNGLLNDGTIVEIKYVSDSHKTKKKKSVDIKENLYKDLVINLLDLHKGREKESEIVEMEDPVRHDRKLNKYKKRKKKLLEVEDLLNDNIIKNTYDVMGTHRKQTNELDIDNNVRNEVLNDGIINNVSDSHKRKKKKSTVIEEVCNNVPLDDISILDDNLFNLSKGRKKKSLDAKENPNNDHVMKSDKHKKGKKKSLMVEDPSNELLNDSLINNTYDALDTDKKALNEVTVNDVMNELLNDGIIHDINDLSHSRKEKKEKYAAIEANLDMVTLNDIAIVIENSSDLHKGITKKSVVTKDNPDKDSSCHKSKMNKHKTKKKKLQMVEDLNEELLNDNLIKQLYNVMESKATNDSFIQEINDIPDSLKIRKKKPTVVEENLNKISLNGASILDSNLLECKHKKRKNKLLLEDLNEPLNDSVIINIYDVLDSHKTGINEAILDDASNQCIIEEIRDGCNSPISWYSHKGRENKYSLFRESELDKREKRKNRVPVVDELTNELLDYYNALEIQKKIKVGPTDDVTNQLLNDIGDVPGYNSILEINDVFESRKEVNLDEVLSNFNLVQDDNLLRSHKKAKKKSGIIEENTDLLITSLVQECNDKVDEPKRRKSKVVSIQNPSNESLNFIHVNTDNKKSKKNFLHASKELLLDSVIQDSNASDTTRNKETTVLEDSLEMDTYKRKKNKSHLGGLTDELLNAVRIQEGNDLRHSQKGRKKELVFQNKVPLYNTIQDNKLDLIDRITNISAVEENREELLNNSMVKDKNTELSKSKKRKTKPLETDDLLNELLNDFTVALDSHKTIKNKLPSIDDPNNEFLNTSTLQVYGSHQKRKTKSATINPLLSDILIYDGDKLDSHKMRNNETTVMEENLNLLRDIPKRPNFSIQATSIELLNNEVHQNSNQNERNKYPVGFDQTNEGNLDVVQTNKSLQDLMDSHEERKTKTTEDNQNKKFINEVSVDSHESKRHKSPIVKVNLENVEENKVCDTSILDNSMDELYTPKKSKNILTKHLIDELVKSRKRKNISILEEHHELSNDNLDQDILNLSKRRKTKSVAEINPQDKSLVDSLVLESMTQLNSPKKRTMSTIIEKNTTNELSDLVQLSDLLALPVERKSESFDVEKRRRSAITNYSFNTRKSKSPGFEDTKNFSRNESDNSTCGNGNESDHQTKNKNISTNAHSTPLRNKVSMNRIKTEIASGSEIDRISRNISLENEANENEINFAKLITNDSVIRPNKTNTSSPVKDIPAKRSKSSESRKIKQTFTSTKNSDENTPNKFSIENFLLDKPKLKFSQYVTSSETLSENKFKSILKQSAREETMLANEYSLLRNLCIEIDWDVPLLHRIETRISTGLTKDQWAQLKLINIKVKNGSYTREEDNTIIRNFEDFCKKHNLPNDPKPFKNIQINKINLLTPVERVKFGQYIGRGLNNRLLCRIYKRFQVIFSEEKKGRFTKDEDDIIIKYMAEKNEDSSKFSTLSKILNRQRLAIEKRYKTIIENKSKEDKKPIKLYTRDIVTEFLTTLKKVTKVSKWEELKNRVVTSVEWKKISKKMDVPVKNLQLLWTRKLYSEVFATEPLDVNKCVWKLIDKFIKNGEDDYRSLNWKEIAKDFNGLSYQWLHYNFSRAIAERCPAPIQSELKECLNFLKTKLENTKLFNDPPKIIVIEGEVHVL